MTIEETKNLIDKIKIYRQTFAGSLDKSGVQKLITEWFKILEPYDYEDVDRKLNEYFKNGDNYGKYPDAYYLTKYLKKSEDKLQQGHYYVNCQNCQKQIDLANYDKHISRCNSIDYLCRMSKRYYQKNLDKSKLWNLSNEEFEDKYWKFCDKLYDILETGFQKRCLKNAILTHNGYSPEYSSEELFGRFKES